MKLEEFELNEKSINFLQQIESIFNSEIEIEFIDEEEHIHGYASSHTGIPEIQINKNEKFKTEVLIHEAYHLRLHFADFQLFRSVPEWYNDFKKPRIYKMVYTPFLG